MSGEQHEQTPVEAEAGRIVEDHRALHAAIGGVLFSVSNFPEAAQSRLLGQNMMPLNEKLQDAVLAAGFRRVRALPDREAIARALYLHSYEDGDWGGEDPYVREVYLLRADAVLALFGQEGQR